MAEHRVVIVGAGFAGLKLAHDLRRAPVAITVIDQRNHHLFQPLLYQVATTLLATSEIAWPIRRLFRDRPEVTTLLAQVRGVDRSRREVLLRDGESVRYDTLVLATGARHAYFGHDEWEPSAPGLKTLEDATTIRRRLLLAFEHAERETDPEARKALMTFCVIGGGPTGVELTGIIAELAQKVLPAEFRSIDTRQTRVLLVEAGPRVLPAFSEKVSAYATRALERIGAEVQCGAPVTGCDDTGITIGERFVPARTVIWAAGVQASNAARWLDAPADRAGRVIVEPDLTVPGLPDVFVDRRHGARRVAGQAGAGDRAGREAAGRLRGAGDPGAPRRQAGAAAVRLPPFRQPRDRGPKCCGDRFRPGQADGVARLVDLGHRAHLLPDRHPQPHRGGDELALVLRQRPAQRPADHPEGDAARGGVGRHGVGARIPLGRRSGIDYPGSGRDPDEGRAGRAQRPRP